MPKKIKFNKERRVCKVSGCGHILSIYNPEGYCYAHQRQVDAITQPPVTPLARQNAPPRIQ